LGCPPGPVAAAETRGWVFFCGHGTRAARVFSCVLFWGGAEWADPLRVLSNFRLFCGQPEGTSAPSAVELAIKSTRPASDTPWAVAAVHRGRGVKNARKTIKLPEINETKTPTIFVPHKCPCPRGKIPCPGVFRARGTSRGRALLHFPCENTQK